MRPTRKRIVLPVLLISKNVNFLTTSATNGSGPLPTERQLVFGWRPCRPERYRMILKRLLAPVILMLLVWAESAQELSAEPAARPDILLIMPDQMRGDCLSALGHPAVCTPNLDRLARQGTLFRRAYSTVPSCIPARYAMLTGLYPQTSGVVGFRQKRVTSTTMPRMFSDAGYLTALVGREMHQVASDAELGYQLVIHGSTYVSDDAYAADLKRAVPGMQDVRSWVGSLGLTYNHWQAAPWPLDDQLHPTTWIVGKARDAVAKANIDTPLFLTVSFYAPHPPLFPPQSYFAQQLQKPLTEPARGDWVDWTKLTTNGTDGGHRVLLEGETLHRAQAGYFGLIEHIDHEIASLITDFRARCDRARRPWLIAFSADHGEMLGDHGYFRKCEPFEGSANIPLIVCGSPELGFQPGQRNAQPVCLEDLLPTLSQLAGVPCPDVDGISLVPVLRGEEVTVRDWLHFEHATCYSKSQAFHALSDGHMKYVWRPLDGRELLFDLDDDPREERDLSGESDHRDQLERWRSRMIARLADRPEGFSDGQQLLAGRPYPPLNSGMPLRDVAPGR